MGPLEAPVSNFYFIPATSPLFEGNKSLIAELRAKVSELEARISDGQSTLNRRNEECDCYREMLNRIATDRSLTRAQCAELAAETIAAE